MRKVSVKIGVAAVFAVALFALSISQASADSADVEEVKCDDGDRIQEAIDDAEDGDTIVVSGTCTEIVTITTNGITVIGGSGTLNGGFIVDGARRVVIDNLTIDGGCAEPCQFDANTRLDGVRAQNNAHVTVRNSTIENHTRSAVNIRSTSSGLVEGNTISNNADYGVIVNLGSFALLRGTAENPTQTITSSSDLFCCGNAVGVFNSSSARLNGGNEIQSTGLAPAISIFSLSFVRLQNGSNTVTSSEPTQTRAATFKNGSTFRSARFWARTSRPRSRPGW